MDPISFPDMGKIWYKYQHTVLFCTCGCRENRRLNENYIYTCTVKHYDILEIKNALVKSVHCVRDCTADSRVKYRRSIKYI